MNWEKLEVYVQRDKRSGVILRLQEEPPTEYLIELKERRIEARRAFRERINGLTKKEGKR